MKKKVLFLVTSLSRAGAETQLVNLVNGIDPSQFDKTLVIFDKNVDQLGRVDSDNVDFFQFVRANKYDGRIVLKLASLLRTKKPHAIHCTNQFTMLLAWAATKLIRDNRPKLLVTLHSTKGISFSAELLERTLYRWVMKRFDCTIFVCNAQAEYWQDKYKELKKKSAVVYNGVDADFFNPINSKNSALNLRNQLAIAPCETVIACVASLRPEKAHALLIDAYSQLHGQPHLILAGDGILRSQVESQLKMLGLKHRSHLLGNIEDVRPVLELADLTVLSSVTETFSISMLESMAMRTPVVATNVGGLREAVIPNETGYLLTAGNVSDLKNALSDAISDRSNLAQLGANARRLVLEKFSTAKMIQQTSNVLCRVIDH